MGKENNKKNLNKQEKQKSAYHGFKTRKEFVNWLIGMIIAYGIGIGCIVGAFYDKKMGDGSLYGGLLVSGLILLLVLTGLIIGGIASELGVIFIGVMLILLCVVLPIVSGYYIIILLTYLLWISGILMIIDSIAKLTNTTEKKYYKVIFGIAGKMFNNAYNRMTGKKKSKAEKHIEVVAGGASRVWEIIVKGFGIVFALVLLIFGCFCLYHQFIWQGIGMILGALFMFFCIM